MVVSSQTLGLDDILVVKVPVGAMPPGRAREFLEETKTKFQEVFGTHNKILMLASRGEDSAEIVIIKRTM